MVSMSLLSRATGWISSATAYPRGTPAVASNAAPMERKALAEGETAVIILVGTTGSGKSTFANMLVDPAQDENLQVCILLLRIAAWRQRHHTVDS